MPRKPRDIAYRPCEGGCGGQVNGRTKLCLRCAPKCPCGHRARTGKTTCLACSRDGVVDVDEIQWVRRGAIMVKAG